MTDRLQHYIDGRWVDSSEPRTFDVIDPSTEDRIGRIALGGSKDVDLAVAAARRAFESYSRTSRDERLALLRTIATEYQKRYAELAKTISQEMGAPLWLSNAALALLRCSPVSEGRRRTTSGPTPSEPGAII